MTELLMFEVNVKNMMEWREEGHQLRFGVLITPTWLGALYMN